MDGTSNENDPSFNFSHLYLKKIVKENHGDTIRQLKFCETHPNLLASVGGTQASIYDNENCGEHLDIMMNFVNMDTPALLAVLASCKRALQGESRLARVSTPSAAHPVSFVSNGVSSVIPSCASQNPEYVELGEASKVQMNAMRIVVDEGGFDEDIFIGASAMGIFPSISAVSDVDSNPDDGEKGAIPGEPSL